MRTLTIILSLLCCLQGRAETVSIDTARVAGVCEGWGVSLCWWAKECGQWSEEKLDSLIDWLVSPQGLNYNVFRYNIGGGDDPEWAHCTPHHFGLRGGKGLRAEMEGFRDGLQGDYDWSRDESQRRIMLMIRERRPDAVFEAFSNSAPWWMTLSGCCAGNKIATEDNLAPSQYSAFARYLVDVCLHYRQEYGIEFRTLEPFNEPMTDYWRQNGGQEGCHFDVESQIALLRVLYPMLRESGLTTVISASDETSVEQSLRDLRAYSEAGVLPMLGQWNTHTYEGSREAKARLKELCDSLGIPLWQSETGAGGRGLMGNLGMAQRLVDDIRYLKPRVWCDWQYVEQNFDQWSLVRSDRGWDNFLRHSNYYVRQHFSRFVPKGYRWLEIDDEHGLAALSPDGRTLVYVTLNVSNRQRTVQLQLPEGAIIRTVYRTSRKEQCEEVSHEEGLELPPMSIITAICSL